MFPSRTISALSRAMSVPLPIAIPTVASIKAGVSSLTDTHHRGCEKRTAQNQTGAHTSNLSPHDVRLRFSSLCRLLVFAALAAASKRCRLE